MTRRRKKAPKAELANLLVDDDELDEIVDRINEAGDDLCAEARAAWDTVDAGGGPGVGFMGSFTPNPMKDDEGR